MDALYFRVSSDRQTTENQFEDLVEIAERDPADRRDWVTIRSQLKCCITAEEKPYGTTYRIDERLQTLLAQQYVYIDQGVSAKSEELSAIRRRRQHKTIAQVRYGPAANTGSWRVRPMFELMKKDASRRCFTRVLVWKPSRLGRSMMDVLRSVWELSETGVTVEAVRSATGPITSSMGRLLWAVHGWFAEMENLEKSEAIHAGLKRARDRGQELGRRRRIFDRDRAVDMRRAGFSWKAIGDALGVSASSAKRGILERMKTYHNPDAVNVDSDPIVISPGDPPLPPS